MKIDQAEHLLHVILETGEPMILTVGGEPSVISGSAILVIPIRIFGEQRRNAASVAASGR
ncbi:MAG: hypothetical protein M3Y22_17050 [Pseudomonadota bacterium]|nr:hypothetical protein [Pseudomonadota bacterium]